ncbi:MAG TPA: hypothetical protein VKA40_09850 [Nitrososphaera sp.]|nr:hypothetical protein [Nitrososphaera sp.]
MYSWIDWRLALHDRSSNAHIAYTIKDVILKLSEYGELNQSRLISYWALNN